MCNQVMKFILDRIDKDERQAAKRRKKEEVVEAKRRLANASKLSSLLYRHKESLKMEILKKRALLDKELQLEAQVRTTGKTLFIPCARFQKGHNITGGAFTPCVLRRNSKGICCKCVRRRRGLRPPPPLALSCNTPTATVLSTTTQPLPQRTSENGRRRGRRRRSPRRRR